MMLGRIQSPHDLEKISTVFIHIIKRQLMIIDKEFLIINLFRKRNEGKKNCRKPGFLATARRLFFKNKKK